MRVGRVPKEEWSMYRNLILPFVYDQMTEETALVFGIVEEKKAVGAMVILLFEEGPEIASICIDPDHRKKGLATYLIAYAEFIAADSGTDLLITLSKGDEYQKLLCDMVVKRGYEHIDSDYGEYLFLLSQVSQEHSKIDKIPENTVFIKDLPDTKKRLYGGYALTHSLPISPKGFFSDKLDIDVSAVVTGDNDRFAYALVDRVDNDRISISGIYNGTQDPRVLMGLLNAVINKIKQKYPPETNVSVVTINKAAEKIVNYFVPDIDNDLYIYQYAGR